MSAAPSDSNSAREVQFEVDGLTYAGLRWGDSGRPLALALHGWLDNALSFSRLGPALRQCQLLALDLSGHGLSSHRSVDATYQIWDDVPQLEAIVRQLGVDRVILVGHSRGAAVAALLASVLGDCCSHLVFIDGLLPRTTDPDPAPVQLKRFVTERRKYLNRPERVFASRDDFTAKYASYGFSPGIAALLAPRAITALDGADGRGGYRLCSDPRLLGASAMKLDDEDRIAYYRDIMVPTLGIFADAGFLANATGSAMNAEAGRYIADYRSTILAGTHHLHLESCPDTVAARIDLFLATGN